MTTSAEAKSGIEEEMVAIGLEVEELRAASSAQSQAAADANAKVEEMKARLAVEGARHAEADQAMQQAADAAEAAAGAPARRDMTCADAFTQRLTSSCFWRCGGCRGCREGGRVGAVALGAKQPNTFRLCAASF